MIKIIMFLALILFVHIISFSQSNRKKEIESVKQADIDFSSFSKEKGMREAFLEFASLDGVMLRPYMMPVVGYDAIKKLLYEDETLFTLTWSPLYGDAAESGELGYTYGTYELIFKNEKGEEETRKGTYVTIWKKDSNGKWKWVLDTGNPGLAPKK